MSEQWDQYVQETWIRDRWNITRINQGPYILRWAFEEATVAVGDLKGYPSLEAAQQAAEDLKEAYE